MPLASLYLRVFPCSALPSILLWHGGRDLPLRRHHRMPLQALAVSTVLNIGLDLIFVPYSTGASPGVAIATAITYAVSAATLFIRLLETNSVIRVTPRDLA